MNNTMTLRGSDSLARDTRLVLALLEKLQGGMLEVRLPDGSSRLFGAGEHGVTLQVHDEAMFSQVLARGDIGLAEAYLDGHWDSPDVTGLLTLLTRNRDVLKKAVYGSWRNLIAARVRHWLNNNSRAGSKRNIMAHYDLGNDFYKLWLDPSMSYSSALYRAVDGGDLETAQRAKYRRILRRLHAEPGQSVLEVGCGWGGFAEMAVQEGLRVTGLTLSPSQLEWSQARAQRRGFADLAEFSLTDYRDLRGQYDHVVSIEMFEAVGERFWPSYFQQLERCLKPGGRAAVQTITIANERFGAYRRGTDFIQRHIFPGGMLPSPEVFERRAASADFSVLDRHAFGMDYARTLAHWQGNFEAAWPEIAAQGFDARFRRLWRFYLAYCEAGFRSGATDVYQFLLEKPRT